MQSSLIAIGEPRSNMLIVAGLMPRSVAKATWLSPARSRIRRTSDGESVREMRRYSSYTATMESSTSGSSSSSPQAVHT